MDNKYIKIKDKIKEIAQNNNLELIDLEYKSAIYKDWKALLFFEYIFDKWNWYKKLHINKDFISQINKEDFDVIEYL